MHFLSSEGKKHAGSVSVKFLSGLYTGPLVYIRVIYPCFNDSALALDDVCLKEIELNVKSCVHGACNLMSVAKEMIHVVILSELFEAFDKLASAEESEVEELDLPVVDECIGSSVEHQGRGGSLSIFDFSLARKDCTGE